MKKRLLSLALCLVLVVGLFSGLTVNASASKIDDLKKEVAEKLIKKKIEQLKEVYWMRNPTTYRLSVGGTFFPVKT